MSELGRFHASPVNFEQIRLTYFKAISSFFTYAVTRSGGLGDRYTGLGAQKTLF